MLKTSLLLATSYLSFTPALAATANRCSEILTQTSAFDRSNNLETQQTKAHSSIKLSTDSPAMLEISELINQRTQLINSHASRILVDVLDKDIKAKLQILKQSQDKIRTLVEKNQQKTKLEEALIDQQNPRRTVLVSKEVLATESNIKGWRLNEGPYPTGSRAQFEGQSQRLFFTSDHEAGPPPFKILDLKKGNPTESTLFANLPSFDQHRITTDGSIMVTSYQHYAPIRVYDLNTKALKFEFSPTSHVEKYELAENLGLVFVKTHSRTLEVFNYLDGTKLGIFNNDKRRIDDFQIDSSRSQIIIWGQEPGEVFIYSLISGELTSRLIVDIDIERLIKKVIPLRGQDALLVQLTIGSPVLLNSLTGEVIRRFETNEKSPFEVHLSPDEKKLAVSFADSGQSSLMLFDINGNLLKSFKQNAGLYLQFSPGGRYLVSSSVHWRDSELFLYDVHKLKRLRSETFTNNLITQFYFSADGKSLFTNGNYLHRFDAMMNK